MRRDDVSCAGGNAGFRLFALASRSRDAGAFRRQLRDPLLVGAFLGLNAITSRLAVAGRAVRIDRPPDLSATELPSDFYFGSCAVQNGARRIRRDSHRDFRMIPEYPQLDCVPMG
jgi:hypothetical protein